MNQQMVPTATHPNPSSEVSGTARLAFYMVMGALALLEVFVSFRGLKSPAGMEQAQLAREVARGHGWVTQCVRPGAWQQMLDSKPEELDLKRFPDTSSAPLPALLLVPFFKMAESWWEFDPGANGVVYALDRISAGMGVLFLLLLVYHLHSLALRLFDERVAVIAAVGAGFCRPLWELAVSGSPRILLGLQLVLGLRLVLSVLERMERGMPAHGRLLALGLIAGAMTMTHGYGVVWAVALMVGVVMGLGRESRVKVGTPSLIALLATPLLMVTGIWMWRNWQITGDMLGASKLMLRGLISGVGEEAVSRRFSEATESMAVPQVIRGFGLKVVGQLDGILGHLGLIVAAPLALVAWLHRFRRSGVEVISRLLLLILGASVVAMGLTAPVTELMDEHNVFILLAPVLSVLGVAMVTMIWSRLNPGARGFWPTWGHGVVLLALSTLPLVMSLPDTLRSGLAFRGRLSQWPPYAADRVQRVATLLEDKEIVMADAPWFTAWYADVTSVWMPSRRPDLALIREAAEKAGHPVAGVVVTPVSAKAESMVYLLNGPWSDWSDVVLRGPMMAFDREMQAWPDFPFPVAVPLVGFSVGEAEGLGLLMAFYTDRVRTPRKLE